MGKRVYDVPDMHCEHCKKKIAAALKAAGAGFFGCKVSLEERTVTVSKDEIDVPKVLADTGYTATLRQA
ncbi:copper chaperone [Jonquetella anthropi DSM 22815]|uniref:Copper chaperone n=1 Tax=Jonquetella anthropi DSM 22815 TaxID=885272 RepID=H0UJQ0_9BACT|nr:cation transporter [Jonquetella anthropi]EHM12909.1 copper chaperone [Jonquetella anthropi DSM 22815]